MDMNNDEEPPEYITVDITQGLPCVWKADDVLSLRKLRLVGSLIGGLPRKPWQNSVHSLPVLLLPEEVTVLRLIGRLALASIRTDGSKPSSDQCKNIEQHRDKVNQDQIRYFVMVRDKKRETFKNKEQLRQLDDGGIEDSPADERGAVYSKVSEGRRQNVEIDELDLDMEVSDVYQHYYRNAVWTLVPSTYDNTEKEDNCKFWTFPTLPPERRKFAVFYNLWTKGYYITTAEKFGADYLVYPSDPLRYHSVYIIHVCHKEKQFTFSDLVSYARLGSSVRKRTILAYTEDHCQDKVHFYSLAWAGYN